MHALPHLAAAAVVGCLSTAAVADPAGNDPFTHMRVSPSYRSSAFRAAQASPVWINNRCADAKGGLEDEVGIVAAPTFDAQGAAQSGAWIQHIRVEGCGIRRQFNVLFRVRNPGDISAIPVLPGTTRTDPALGSDSTTMALAAAAKGSSCKGAYILDTAFIGFANAASAPGKAPWTERWTVAQCDVRVPILMRFTPDATGTSIAAHRDTP